MAHRLAVESTEIRNINQEKIKPLVNAIQMKSWEKVKFDHHDIPSYTGLKENGAKPKGFQKRYAQ